MSITRKGMIYVIMMGSMSTFVLFHTTHAQNSTDNINSLAQELSDFQEQQFTLANEIKDIEEKIGAWIKQIQMPPSKPIFPDKPYIEKMIRGMRNDIANKSEELREITMVARRIEFDLQNMLSEKINILTKALNEEKEMMDINKKAHITISEKLSDARSANNIEKIIALTRQEKLLNAKLSTSGQKISAYTQELEPARKMRNDILDELQEYRRMELLKERITVFSDARGEKLRKFSQSTGNERAWRRKEAGEIGNLFFKKPPPQTPLQTELKLFNPSDLDIPPRSVQQLTVSPNPYPHAYWPYGIKPITENPVPIAAHNTPSLKLYIPPEAAALEKTSLFKSLSKIPLKIISFFDLPLLLIQTLEMKLNQQEKAREQYREYVDQAIAVNEKIKDLKDQEELLRRIRKNGPELISQNRIDNISWHIKDLRIKREYLIDKAIDFASFYFGKYNERIGLDPGTLNE